MLKPNTSTSSNSYSSFRWCHGLHQGRNFQALLQTSCLCDQRSSQLAGSLCDRHSLPVHCGECLCLGHSQATQFQPAVGEGGWAAEETVLGQPRVLLTPALPSPLLQLKGPDLPKILIQTEIFVKGQSGKNSLSNSQYFGTQIQKMC